MRGFILGFLFGIIFTGLVSSVYDVPQGAEAQVAFAIATSAEKLATENQERLVKLEERLFRLDRHYHFQSNNVLNPQTSLPAYD